MITMKQTAPEQFSILDNGNVVAYCHFTSDADRLIIKDIFENDQIDGLDAYDALLRAVASFTAPLNFSKVVCYNESMFDRLALLRFEAALDCMQSTPEEVLRHLCKDA